MSLWVREKRGVRTSIAHFNEASSALSHDRSLASVQTRERRNSALRRNLSMYLNGLLIFTYSLSNVAQLRI